MNVILKSVLIGLAVAVGGFLFVGVYGVNPDLNKSQKRKVVVEVDTFCKYIELCIPDLYRMAFCVFGRQEHACDLVMKACLEGARQFLTSRDERNYI